MKDGKTGKNRLDNLSAPSSSVLVFKRKKFPAAKASVQGHPYSSLAFLQSVLDSMDALVYVTDIKTYEILFLNKFGKETWGDVEGSVCWQALQTGQQTPCRFCADYELFDSHGKPRGINVCELQNTVTGKWFEWRTPRDQMD